MLNMTVPAGPKGGGSRKLPCHRIGRRLRFHVAEIMATAIGGEFALQRNRGS